MTHKRILAAFSVLTFSTALGCSSSDLSDLPTDAQNQNDSTFDDTAQIEDTKIPSDARNDVAADARNDSSSDTKSDASTDVQDTSALDTSDTSADVQDTFVTDASVDSANDTLSDSFYEDSTVEASADVSLVDAATDTSVSDTFIMDTASDSSMSTCHLVINEVQTGSPGKVDDEFVEIYNPCATAFTMTNWTIVYRGKNGTTDTLVYSFPTTGAPMINSGAYFVVGHTGVYTGPKDADFSINPRDSGSFYTSLSSDSGGIALRDNAGVIVDSMTYGTPSPTHAFTETDPAAASSNTGATAQSMMRRPDGTDNDNNKNDFKVGASTPKATNGT